MRRTTLLRVLAGIVFGAVAVAILLFVAESVQPIALLANALVAVVTGIVLARRHRIEREAAKPSSPTGD